MRIPLHSLDAISDDPLAFQDEVESDDKVYARPGRNYYMQSALLKWHKGDLTLAEARQEMMEKCERFKDGAELKRTIRKFDKYVSDYQGIDTQTRFTRLKVAVPLPKDVDRRFVVSGIVRRLDKNPDGTYTAWLFTTERDEGPQRMYLPLFQNAVASCLNFDLEEVKIGIYCFADGSSLLYQFDQDQVDAARTKLQELLTTLAPLAEREPMPHQTEMDFWE